MIDSKKTGRPSNSEGQRQKLKLVALKIDAETEVALDKLIANAMRSNMVKLVPGLKSGGLRSAVIRQAVIEAANRLP